MECTDRYEPLEPRDEEWEAAACFLLLTVVLTMDKVSAFMALDQPPIYAEWWIKLAGLRGR